MALNIDADQAPVVSALDTHLTTAMSAGVAISGGTPATIPGLPHLDKLSSDNLILARGGVEMGFTAFLKALLTAPTYYQVAFINGVLLYKAKAGDFTAGQVVTGAGGATGTIVSKTVLSPTTGSLTLTNVSGIFVDNEAITDPLGGSALADGTYSLFSQHPDINYGAGSCRYWKDPMGYICLDGLADTPSSPAGKTLAQLPAGYRPSTGNIFPAAAGGSHGKIQVMSNGNITVVEGPGLTWISLAGIRFYAG